MIACVRTPKMMRDYVHQNCWRVGMKEGQSSPFLDILIYRGLLETQMDISNNQVYESEVQKRP